MPPVLKGSPNDEVTIASTTDSEAQVRAAAGMPADTETPPATETTPALAAPAAGDTTTTEEPAAPAEAAPAETTPASARKTKPSAKDRIATLTGRNAELIRDNMAATAELAETKARLEALEKGGATTTDRDPAAAVAPVVKVDPYQALGPKPKREDFDDIDAYLDARDAYMDKKHDIDVDVKVTGRLEQSEEGRHAAAMREAHERTVATFTQRVQDVRAELPDYDAVTTAAKIPLTQAMRDYVLNEENGPKIGYYLSKNLNVLDEILRMGPGRQLVEMGRLDERLRGGRLDLGAPAKDAAPDVPATTTTTGPAAAPAGGPVADDAPPAQRTARVSNAPDPAPHVDTGGGARPKATLAGAKSYADWKKLRGEGVRH